MRFDVLRRSATWGEAWRGGVFCEFGCGEIGLGAFLRELTESGYAGSLVIE
jgi:sugar phosphate isomerase/epimerase